MKFPRRHRRDGDDDEERDWRERRGRFAGLDPDTPDRPQVMPVPEPPAERQTHNRLADLAGSREDDDPGRWGDHGGS